MEALRLLLFDPELANSLQRMDLSKWQDISLRVIIRSAQATLEAMRLPPTLHTCSQLSKKLKYLAMRRKYPNWDGRTALKQLKEKHD